MFDLRRLLLMFVEHFPLGVIWTVGIVLALRRWRQHPQMSLLVIIAFGLELARSVFGTLADFWIRLQMQSADRMTGEVLMNGLWILFYVRWGVDICAWTLVLIALFRWRHLPRRLRGPDGEYLPEDFEAKVG